MKRNFRDYLFPIVEEKKYKDVTSYFFKIIARGKEKYEYGYVEPSLEELPHLELTDFLDHGSLIIKPDFVRLEVKPRRMLIYLKPFEVIEFAKWIRELGLKEEFKPRIVRENFEINLPKTYISVETTFYVFEYHRKPEFYRPGKVIMCNYDTPITKNFITWVFKEVEKEFLLFLEAYEEERRRQQNV